ncbi:hypothetical protein DMN91_010195 [Ooceraea biroi]|uniref:Odorant receptor n=1 Tax=Ooceraea biroi TaxID=2015173 RepID=A0A026X1K0_OOCBI|nr:uncharacterized protein LOC105279276 [Ooceraea biroi]EZA62175.1 hypothetical protein X777_05713 [Ooceraea biroi]RLU17955.1 hypothetical protein DMN91_010195 [Ooceraea biroi]
MVFMGERCYKIHRIMFMAMGLWPYQKLFIWRIQTVIFFMIYSGCFLGQFMAFLTTTCDMDCFVKRFSYICINFIYIGSYYSFYFNSETIKQVLEHIQLDWKMFENSDAIKLFEEYLFGAYILSLFTYLIVPSSLLLFAALEYRPVILDAIIPMNVSRPRKTEVDFELLFFDKQEYFFLFIMAELFAITIGFFSLLVPGTFFVTLGRHCCATYKIASCLIENTAIVHMLQIPFGQKIQFMHQSICLSLYIHRRTFKFAKDLILSFDLWYFPLILICALSLSCFLFRLYNSITRFNDFHEMFVSCVILFGYLLYMFLANLLAQSYTEHSVEILKSTYDTLWYLAPLSIQKLFLIMQESIKAHSIAIGGLFALSMEGFSGLLTTAVSYFTVLHTIHSGS